MFRFCCVALAFCVLLCGTVAADDVSTGESTTSDFIVDAVETAEDNQDGDILSADASTETFSEDSAADVDNAALDDSFSDDSESIDNDVETLLINANNVVLNSASENNDYPADAPLMGGLYMDVTTSELGDILIYVPADYQYKSFGKTADGVPVNITASTISGYTYDGNNYYIRWSSFGTAQYRSSSSSYNYSALTITAINNTNIVFVESNEDLPVVPDNDMTNIITVFMLGVIILCLFMKRF